VTSHGGGASFAEAAAGGEAAAAAAAVIAPAANGAVGAIAPAEEAALYRQRCVVVCLSRQRGACLRAGGGVRRVGKIAVAAGGAPVAEAVVVAPHAVKSG